MAWKRLEINLTEAASLKLEAWAVNWPPFIFGDVTLSLRREWGAGRGKTWRHFGVHTVCLGVFSCTTDYAGRLYLNLGLAGFALDVAAKRRDRKFFKFDLLGWAIRLRDRRNMARLEKRGVAA